MPFYERQLDLENGKVPVAGLDAILSEFGRGRLTQTQANDAILWVSGVPFSTTEQTEIADLLSTITGNGTAKLARSKEILDVLTLAEMKTPGYDTPTLLRTRLGVPAR